MAGKVRYLHYKRGRYSARLVVPKELRPFLENKTELTKALGADRRAAIRALPGAVAVLQTELAKAERNAAGAGKIAVQPGRYPMQPDQLAASLYSQRLAFDDALRNDPRWPTIGIDDRLVMRLRSAVAGQADNAELQSLVGAQVERFRSAGNLTAEIGSDEWRLIARSLCIAELEALERVAERDEGDFTGLPRAPIICDAQPIADAPTPVSMTNLWADYTQARVQAGFMKDGGKRGQPVIENLRKFLRHNDASRITRKDLLEWRDHLMLTLSAKTTNDIYLSAVRSLFNWAHENERLPENVAATVKQPKPRKVHTRERGYTDAEAVAVLIAARKYQPVANAFGYVRETHRNVASKRWAPILCAFSGARISEITQLRKEDIRQEGDTWVMRITPDAGTVKSGGYRDVPLHSQIITMGFIDFVNAAEPGPMFHPATDPAKYATAAQTVSDEIAKWLRRNNLAPEAVQPNHAWRHRLKTQARDIGIDMRVIDAIQGHVGRTAGDSYGDVSMIAKSRAIEALPEYELNS